MAAAIPTALSVGSELMGAYGKEKSEEAASQRRLREQGRQIESTEKMFGQNLEFQKSKEEADRKAYEAALGRGLEQYGEGERALTESFTTPSKTLSQLEQDIASGNTEALQAGSRQLQSDLAAQGVRGGQAATLLKRGTGEQVAEAQEQLNELKYKDEAQRLADQRAYLMNKARAGQAASLAGIGR